MKKSAKLTIACISAAALAAAVAAGVLYFIAVTQNFDRTISHFNDSPTVTAFVCCFIAAAALAAAAGIASRKKATVRDGGSYNLAVIIPFTVTGALILASGIIGIVDLIRATSPTEISRDYITSVAAPILAVFASVYFLLISGGEKTESVRSFFGIAAMVWALVCTLDVYFRKGEPINSAAKAILLTTTIVDLLFISEDVRFTLRTQTVAAYRTVSLLCVSAGIAFGVPNLIVALVRLADAEKFTAPETDIIVSAIAVMLGVCAAVRLLTLKSSLAEYVPPKHEKKKEAKSAEANDSES